MTEVVGARPPSSMRISVPRRRRARLGRCLAATGELIFVTIHRHRLDGAVSAFAAGSAGSCVGPQCVISPLISVYRRLVAGFPVAAVVGVCGATGSVPALRTDHFSADAAGFQRRDLAARSDVSPVHGFPFEVPPGAAPPRSTAEAANPGFVRGLHEPRLSDDVPHGEVGAQALRWPPSHSIRVE